MVQCICSFLWTSDSIFSKGCPTPVQFFKFSDTGTWRPFPFLYFCLFSPCSVFVSAVLLLWNCERREHFSEKPCGAEMHFLCIHYSGCIRYQPFPRAIWDDDVITVPQSESEQYFLSRTFPVSMPDVQFRSYTTEHVSVHSRVPVYWK